MDLTLDNIWKRYTSGWVLKGVSIHISHGQNVSIIGLNGSGKSTLLQIISGYLSSSKGKIIYHHEGKNIDRDEIYKYCAITAAYAELDEELSIAELFNHYKIFKPLLLDNLDDFLELTDFVKLKNKQIRHFSSGMKQRLSLGMAFIMDVPILLMDEPTSFLDESKKAWFEEMMNRYTKDKTVIIASNDERDIKTCHAAIELN